ncbi:MAG: hypothetical protein F6K23_39435 [Okeania sp. SIO2C9]|nr:hypothetical protein [Okeania sp. SIO2C9]
MVTTKQVIPIRFTTTTPLAEVERCQFWVTSDNGTSWQLAHEEHIAADATTGPLFRFAVPQDGRYGFRTTAVLHTGTSEAPPQAGDTPSKNSIVVVDATPPQLIKTQAEAKIADSPEHLDVTFSWESSDPHFADCRIEMSLDGESWLLIREDLAASGELPLALPRNASLRLIVSDYAGNKTISQRWSAPQRPVEQPPEQENLQELAQSLPDPNEQTTEEPAGSAAASNNPAPNNLAAQDGQTQEQAAQASANNETTSEPLSSEVVAEPARPVVPPNHQAIVAPNADAVVQVDHKRPTIPRSASGSQQTIITTPSSENSLQDPLTQGRFGNVSTEPQQMLARIKQSSVIVSPLSEQALIAARQALSDGDQVVGLAILETLHNSDISPRAAATAIDWLTTSGDPDQAMTWIHNLPPEANRSSLVACAFARASLAVNSTAKAESLLRRIDSQDENFDEATWLLGRCMQQRGNVNGARFQWQQLAKGSSSWALKAREALQALR